MLVAGQLDDVIPEEDIAAVREEVREAPGKNQANKQDAAGLRRKGRLKYPSEPVSDLVWMPKYAQHLAHPAVVAVAKAMLDDHLRIAQFNFRAIGVTPEEQLHSPNRQFMREWHTDWPHDLIGCKCSRSLCVFFRKPQRSGCTRRSGRAELRPGWRGAPLGLAQFRRRSATFPRCLHVSHDDMVHDGRERAHGGKLDCPGFSPGPPKPERATRRHDSLCPDVSAATVGLVCATLTVNRYEQPRRNAGRGSGRLRLYAGHPLLVSSCAT